MRKKRKERETGRETEESRDKNWIINSNQQAFEIHRSTERPRHRKTDTQRQTERERQKDLSNVLFNFSGPQTFEIVSVSELFLDLDEVPFLYFSQGNLLFRKNMIKSYLLDLPDLVFVLEKNITSLSALVSR
jgi:hypothetical protein